jgi:hypothetical protein
MWVLEDVEEIEAGCLLDFDGRASRELWPDVTHTNVASMPEVFQILPLCGEQCRKTLAHDAIHRPLSPAAEFLDRRGMSGVIDHVFAEVHRTVRARSHHEGNLTKVLLLRKLMGVLARSLDRMIDSAR